MKVDPKVFTLAMLVLIAVIIVAFVTGRGCGTGCTPAVEPVETGIDAGPGEQLIAEQLDGSLVAVQQRIEEIEAAHAIELAAFDEAQRLKYEALRSDPQEADRFIRDFNARLRKPH